MRMMTRSNLQSNMKKRLFDSMVSWPFALSVGLLLLNDLVLKFAYPGFITGKLSDFSGLFMVTLPLLAILPARKMLLCMLVSVLFAWWKSDLSSAFIVWVQAAGLPRFGRTVDLGDLIALTILPIACCVSARIEDFLLPMPALRRLLFAPVAAIALFAMLGTSQLPPKKVDYGIRDTTGQIGLQREAVAAVIASVVRQHGLECYDCAQPQQEGKYFDADTRLDYRFTANGELAFSVSAQARPFSFGKSADQKIEAIRSTLKRELAKRFPNLEYFEPIDARK